MITNAENFECPNCGEPLGEESMMDVCSEPFNGVIVDCPECGRELNLEIRFLIEEN